MEDREHTSCHQAGTRIVDPDGGKAGLITTIAPRGQGWARQDGKRVCRSSRIRGTTAVAEGRTRVGILTAVFVAGGGGRVKVLNGVACVDMACTVNAAAVNTAFGASVAGACDGRLQAASIKMNIKNGAIKRMILDILFS